MKSSQAIMLEEMSFGELLGNLRRLFQNISDPV